MVFGYVRSLRGISGWGSWEKPSGILFVSTTQKGCRIFWSLSELFLGRNKQAGHTLLLR